MLHKWRMYFRKRMPGMTKEKALDMRNKLSFAYNIMAWNVFVITLYYAFKDKFPSGIDSAEYMNILNIPHDPRVLKYSNFTKTTDTYISQIDKGREAKKEVNSD